MQDFVVNLNSEIQKSFLCIKAANSQDIDIDKKSEFKKIIRADIDSPYHIGLIVGNSGSGKTTLARECFKGYFKEESILNLNKAIIDQFPKHYSYEDCQKQLSFIGLTSVPCWIRPAYTLSNGQRFRAEVALQCAFAGQQVVVIDEWTSVVDRTVAKVMSHSIQKFARKMNKKIVLLSCHHDVIDWLQPDWVIDTNTDEFECRRGRSHERKEQLQFEIREFKNGKYWKSFSRYHYLSENLPGGKRFFYGLFHKETPIGFMCFANYVIGRQNILHSNRVVILPDYCGLGLAKEFVNKACFDMVSKGYDIREKNSSYPRYNQLKNDPHWILLSTDFKTPLSLTMKESRSKRQRNNVRFWSWKFIGNQTSL